MYLLNRTRCYATASFKLQQHQGLDNQWPLFEYTKDSEKYVTSTCMFTMMEKSISSLFVFIRKSGKRWIYQPLGSEACMSNLKPGSYRDENTVTHHYKNHVVNV
jgi:hypothetical protein